MVGAGLTNPPLVYVHSTCDLPEALTNKPLGTVAQLCPSQLSFHVCSIPRMRACLLTHILRGVQKPHLCFSIENLVGNEYSDLFILGAEYFWPEKRSLSSRGGLQNRQENCPL